MNRRTEMDHALGGMVRDAVTAREASRWLADDGSRGVTLCLDSVGFWCIRVWSPALIDERRTSQTTAADDFLDTLETILP